MGAGKSIQSQEGREGCLTKPDGKVVVSSFGTRIGTVGTPVPSPGPGQRKYLCAGVPKGGYSVGLLGAKTEIPVKMPLFFAVVGGILLAFGVGSILTLAKLNLPGYDPSGEFWHVGEGL